MVCGSQRLRDFVRAPAGGVLRGLDCLSSLLSQESAAKPWAAADAVTVLIDSNGQLGAVIPSAASRHSLATKDETIRQRREQMESLQAEAAALRKAVERLMSDTATGLTARSNR
jgi:hypothetical protein